VNAEAFGDLSCCAGSDGLYSWKDGWIDWSNEFNASKKEVLGGRYTESQMAVEACTSVGWYGGCIGVELRLRFAKCCRVGGATGVISDGSDPWMEEGRSDQSEG
jgi:hypothetical protein